MQRASTELSATLYQSATSFLTISVSGRKRIDTRCLSKELGPSWLKQTNTWRRRICYLFFYTALNRMPSAAPSARGPYKSDRRDTRDRPAFAAVLEMFAFQPGNDKRRYDAERADQVFLCNVSANSKRCSANVCKESEMYNRPSVSTGSEQRHKRLWDAFVKPSNTNSASFVYTASSRRLPLRVHKVRDSLYERLAKSVLRTKVDRSQQATIRHDTLHYDTMHNGPFVCANKCDDQLTTAPDSAEVHSNKNIRVCTKKGRGGGLLQQQTTVNNHVRQNIVHITETVRQQSSWILHFQSRGYWWQ